MNVALFYTTINDAQVPTLVLPDAVTITKNAGKLHSKGLEMELAATPVKNLEVTYNFGATDAKYTTLKLSQNGSEVNLKGNRQIYSPYSTSAPCHSIWLRSRSKQKLKLVVRGEWMNIGSQFFDLLPIQLSNLITVYLIHGWIGCEEF